MAIVEPMAIARLRPYPGNARTHSKKQVRQIADSIQRFGFTNPVLALVADAIKDCSRRGEIVLDPFGGSGTTLIAADKTGRQARLVEFDRAYCDQTLRRFEQVTGTQARLVATGQSFEDVGEERQMQPNREEGGR
jgi:DNA modification methylase